MENEDQELGNKHIRLHVKEDIEERFRRWGGKKSETILERDYGECVNEISKSTFELRGKRINIFKIKLTGSFKKLDQYAHGAVWVGCQNSYPRKEN
jgi:hypothetical protein